MNVNELASLLSNHTGPVTDQALRQLAVSVRHFQDSANIHDFYRTSRGVWAALAAVEEAVKVEANDGA